MSEPDPEEFRQKWQNYLDQLDRLRLSIPADMDTDDFDDAVETLEHYVAQATLSKQEDNDG